MEPSPQEADFSDQAPRARAERSFVLEPAWMRFNAPGIAMEVGGGSTLPDMPEGCWHWVGDIDLAIGCHSDSFQKISNKEEKTAMKSSSCTSTPDLFRVLYEKTHHFEDAHNRKRRAQSCRDLIACVDDPCFHAYMDSEVRCAHRNELVIKQELVELLGILCPED